MYQSTVFWTTTIKDSTFPQPGIYLLNPLQYPLHLYKDVFHNQYMPTIQFTSKNKKMNSPTMLLTLPKTTAN